MSLPLTNADPALKAQAYAEVGVRITYDPVENTAVVEAKPAAWIVSARRSPLSSSVKSMWRAEYPFRIGADGHG